jgi:heat shock protein HtpX
MNNMKTVLLMGLLTGIFLAIGSLWGRGGLTLALAAAAVMNFVSYFFSDKIVLALYRARRLEPGEVPALDRIVHTLASQAGFPAPPVYLIPGPALNAFATGRNPHHAAVAVTEGLLQRLDEPMLTGVLAHEFAHIKNRDILIGSVAATLAGAIMWAANLVRWGALFGGGRDDRNGGSPLVMLAMVILAPIAAMLVQMAISRSREYEADATGARLAGTPDGLARALKVIEDSSRRAPMPATPATAHMFIMKPFTGRGLMNLFSTHPPVEKRVARLTGRE